MTDRTDARQRSTGASLVGGPPGVRTTLVTGGASGIGLAVCRALTREGWRVLATAMPGQETEALRRAAAVVVEADLADAASLERLSAAIRREPRLDALVSSAGIALPGPVEATSADQLHRQFQVNTIAPALLAQACLPQLRASRGRMVFLGAGQGRVALPLGGAYGASKSALASLTDSLRSEIADTGVTVSLIEPGAVDTGILAASRARGMEMLDGLPGELRERYSGPLLAMLARSEAAFRTAIPPEHVARLVLRILVSSNPKPRYLIGRDAWALAAVALLPAAWRARAVGRLMRDGG